MGRLERVIGTNIISLSTGEIRLGHTWYEEDVIEDIIRREEPEWFIEIGVHEGGLSWMLIPKFPLMHYLGVEHQCDYIRPEVRLLYIEYGQELHCGNCFDQELLAKIATLSKKMIYCDGGDKVLELLSYKNVCNPGDLLFAHDFWDGQRVVREVPTGDVHPEVHLEDIVHLDTSPRFSRYSEQFLCETRIVGWRHVN